MDNVAPLIRPVETTHRRRRPAAAGSNSAGSQPQDLQPGKPVCFPLSLDVRYTSGSRALTASGSGRTTEMSSSEFRFTADRPLAIGLPLHLAVDWPVPLDGGVPLQLIASGEVVWSSGTETALKIQRHEMRTRRAGLTVAASGPFFRFNALRTGR